ncbi:hypothetical protein [Psychrosphaera algicola]|uniref:Uncharacterized protein n=1 Tax=Psychrosphaera algicola TaxID=3023714 RepID=A0ABT5FDU6_9GAMM|nr:hypothetical protein [Psychrosphaera sp. G1-22]MDC2888787.1 hypothetical protein [Psychrosphaera sp. G1-22]
MKAIKIITINLMMSALVSAYGYAADTHLEIFPEQQKQQVKFGADIKLTIKNVAEGNTSKVMDRFIEMGMDMVRLPFFPFVMSLTHSMTKCLRYLTLPKIKDSFCLLVLQMAMVIKITGYTGRISFLTN